MMSKRLLGFIGFTLLMMLVVKDMTYADSFIEIKSQPTSVTCEAGYTAVFTISAKGSTPLNYQWQSRKDSSASWTNSGQMGAKTNTLSVNTSTGLHGWQFRCVVSDKNGHKAYSNVVTITIVPRITSQPHSIEATAGSTAGFYVAASGKGPFSYQWQSRKDSSAAWTNSGQNGAKSSLLYVETVAGLHGWQFRCVVTDANNQKAYSEVAVLSVIPKIITQPVDASAKNGDTVSYSVKATGKGPLTYAWQSRKDASSSWAKSSREGANTPTLSISVINGLDGWQFRCVVTDANGQQARSDSVTLSVLPSITAQPKNAKADVGDVAEFTVSANGVAPLQYQWQSRKDSTCQWTNSGQNGAKTRKLSVQTNAGLNGWQFRCVVTDGKGVKTYSNIGTLTVMPKITLQPYSRFGAAEETVDYSVIVEGKGPFVYQWQSRRDRFSQWANSGLNGAKTSKLLVNLIPGIDGWEFRCIVTDGNGNKVISEAANASVWGAPITSKYFPDKKFRAFVSLNYDTDKDGILAPEEVFVVNKMDIENEAITSLKGIEFFVDLEELYCSNNKLVALDLSKNKYLVDLVCSGNQLKSLNLRNCTYLEYLNCDENNLTELDLENNTFLQFLVCSNNQLTSINIGKCTELKEIFCCYNALESLDVTKCWKLIDIVCNDNSITCLDLKNNTLLWDVECSNNAIPELDLSNCTRLVYLYCMNNCLEQLKLPAIDTVTYITCANNSLTKLDISSYINLSCIDCNYNLLKELDVSRNINLEGLHCQGNQIKELNLKNNVKLDWISCMGNLLSKLDVSACMPNVVVEADPNVVITR